MRPVIVKIEGNYYDSQIYRGRLYLWHFDGRLSVYNWNELIDSIIDDEYVQLAINLSLTDGALLYHSYAYDRLMTDKDVRHIVKDKLQKIANRTFYIKQSQLENFVIKEYDVPTGELPIETLIYDNTLYYATDKGVFKSSVHKNAPVSATKRPNKFWDCRVVSMNIGYGDMSFSAAYEGLWELDVRRGSLCTEPKQLTAKHSSFANYTYASIFNTSLMDESFMLYDEPIFEKLLAQRQRNLTSISEENIFGIKSGSALKWGVKDKLYRVDNGNLMGVKFDNYYQHHEYNRDAQRFANLFDKYDTGGANRRVIGGGAGYFGTIIEYEDGLLILQSDGEKLEINEDVTRWRVFTRSINYENQLHVILDDSLCIYAFLHDYELVQREKIMGILYSEKNGIKKDCSI